MRCTVHFAGSTSIHQAGGDPGIFVRGGPTFRKNSNKQKKKKKTKKNKKKNQKKKKPTRGEGGHLSIYSALVRSKSNLAIEITFEIKSF